MKRKAFDNVKDQIGFCGIWCGSCLVGNGALKELTKRYEDSVQKYGLKAWAFKDVNYEEFKGGLASVQASSTCPGCLNGGGRADCEIKHCALNKKITDCCRCDEFMKCENSEIIHKMRKGARGANILVKDKNVDSRDFVKKGTNNLKKRFPSCILLCNSP